jgi:cell wall-associated NlpC family hydrolase
VNSKISSAGYLDQVDLEFVGTFDGHICQPAPGNYDKPPDDETLDRAMDVEISLRERIVDYAKSFLGVLYEYGGDYPETGYGTDASHFISRVMNKFNLFGGYKNLSELWDFCADGGELNEENKGGLQPADLIFISRNNQFVHAAVYIGGDEWISAEKGNSSITTKALARLAGAGVMIRQILSGEGVAIGKIPI